MPPHVHARKLVVWAERRALSQMMPCPDRGAILVVEDPVIRRFVKTALGPDGRRVIECDAPRAVQILRGPDVSVGLLITNTPGLFTEFSTSVPVLYLAATPDWRIASQFRELRILAKPFGVSELRTAVEDFSRQM